MATWAVAGIVLAGTGPALAVGLTVQSARNPALPGELQILRNQQNRSDFQFQQKIYREQDRQVVPLQQPPRLRVPKMRSDCPIDITGNAAIGGGDCR
ncbi:hypothetical protein [Mesorhizobium sp. ANAO-SY3R2]|uniref:hypothetical protein n=1 Tax=Mesorhizobium sp. ANAO-SY3R2 TaxID=3166644 RepID=UPI00366C362E